MTSKGRTVAKLAAIALLLTVVAWSGCAPAPSDVQVEKEKKVKVGISATLTGAAASSYWAHNHSMFEYLKYVNEELGGIQYADPVTGKTETVKLDILWEDNACNSARSISVWKRWQAAGVMVLTVSCGPSRDGLLAMATRARIPVIGGGMGTTNPEYLAIEPLFWTGFRPSVFETKALIIEWYKDQWTESRRPRVNLIQSDVAVQRMLEQPGGLYDWAESIGVDLLPTEWVPFGTLDHTIQLTRMMNQDIDLLFFEMPVGEEVAMLNDANRLGIIGKVDMCNTGYAFDESLIGLAPGMTEGLITSAATVLPSEIDVPGVKLAHELSQSYHGKDATIGYLAGMAAAMPMVEGIRLALEKVGYENIDGTAINEGLHHITNLDTLGLTAPITVDPKLPVSNTKEKICRVENGKLKAITDWIECPEIRGLYPERFR